MERGSSSPEHSNVVYERLRKLEEKNRDLKLELGRSEESRAELYRLLNQNPQTGLPIRRVFDRDAAAAFENLAKPLAVAVVRLDKSYDRIRNSRDRSRVLLFKTERKPRTSKKNSSKRSDCRRRVKIQIEENHIRAWLCR